MALNWDNVTALTRNLILPGLEDQIFNSNPFLMKMYQKGRKVQGGVKILQPLEYAGTSAADSYSGYDTFSTTPNEMFTDAEYEWRQNYVTINISGLEERKNSGDNAVISLLTSKVNNARKTLEDNLGYQLFAYGNSSDTATHGRGAEGIQGLLSAVDDSSNVDSYGGITRSTYTWWKSGYTSWSATAVSESAIQGIIGDRTIGNSRPDMILTHQDIYDKIFSLLVDKQRYGSEEMLKAGFQSVVVNGIPVVVDSHCGSTDIWFLNTSDDKLDFISHQDAAFKFEPFQKPVDADARTASIIHQGNLVSGACWRQARVHSVNTAL